MALVHCLNSPTSDGWQSISVSSRWTRNRFFMSAPQGGLLAVHGSVGGPPGGVPIRIEVEGFERVSTDKQVAEFSTLVQHFVELLLDLLVDLLLATLAGYTPV